MSRLPVCASNVTKYPWWNMLPVFFDLSLSSASSLLSSAGEYEFETIIFHQRPLPVQNVMFNKLWPTNCWYDVCEEVSPEMKPWLTTNFSMKTYTYFSASPILPCTTLYLYIILAAVLQIWGRFFHLWSEDAPCHCDKGRSQYAFRLRTYYSTRNHPIGKLPNWLSFKIK
jgi:hypothetical protein